MPPRGQPTAAEYVHLEQELGFCVDGGVESSLLAICFDLFLVNRTRDGDAVGGSLCVSAVVSFQYQIAW